tara:strand:+ start:428 stop:634 length:207 start_codon:yes stop_codon:yes gene_type:complete
MTNEYVDRFMDHLKKAINMSVEAERLSQRQWHIRVEGLELRKESEKMIENAECMLYELIANAKDNTHE